MELNRRTLNENPVGVKEATEMKRTGVIIGLALAVGFVALAQRRGWRGAPESLPLPKTAAERKILAVLDEAVKAGEVWASVPASDGRMLRVLTEAVGATNVVEIGTSTGISGLWFSLALQKTDGKLTTFEIDPGRAATAREHFRKAGVDRIVTIVEGDAHENVARLKDPIDLLFIDADKEGYVDYLNKLLPLVRPGGLVLAHNLSMIPDYVKQVTGNPDLETIFYTEGNGLVVTVKKR